MKKSQRLNVVIELHARQEQDALAALGGVQQRLREQQAQLDSLLNYRVEYLHNFAVRQQSGIPVSQLMEFRAFSEKLDSAIDSQRQAVAQQEREVQRARKHWEDSRQRTKSLRKVSELALAEEIKNEQKREQAEQDDRAARTVNGNGTGPA
ncbi:flagellar export protein FliJ [Methylomonas sp. EFPC3]|uniref:flagellar export protein FliJ n=1 Tax=Methylomonas sp. EFPC3 TaxID=3021710 RepID=UPI0024160948|nr:flagellar export protein FliJ [Methylomonas sp. EFPC3]WFP50921.1 flagellar export protein FliJ [Methylomonas sp. EFPC3]